MNELGFNPEPPEGWCNELFKVDKPNNTSIAPIVKWYYCRLPKGHDPEWPHSCYASRLGK